MTTATNQMLKDAWNGDRIVEVDGVRFRMVGDWQTLSPGDTYIAGRNRGVYLLTVKEVRHPEPAMRYTGSIHAVEPAYPYDLHECYKVELADV